MIDKVIPYSVVDHLHTREDLVLYVDALREDGATSEEIVSVVLSWVERD